MLNPLVEVVVELLGSLLTPEVSVTVWVETLGTGGTTVELDELSVFIPGTPDALSLVSPEVSVVLDH